MINTNPDPRSNAGTERSDNEPDPFPITERMFRVMQEYGKDLPNVVNPEDDDLSLALVNSGE